MPTFDFCRGCRFCTLCLNKKGGELYEACGSCTTCAGLTFWERESEIEDYCRYDGIGYDQKRFHPEDNCIYCPSFCESLIKEVLIEKKKIEEMNASQGEDLESGKESQRAKDEVEESKFSQKENEEAGKMVKNESNIRYEDDISGQEPARSSDGYNNSEDLHETFAAVSINGS